MEQYIGVHVKNILLIGLLAFQFLTTYAMADKVRNTSGSSSGGQPEGQLYILNFCAEFQNRTELAYPKSLTYSQCSSFATEMCEYLTPGCSSKTDTNPVLDAIYSSWAGDVYTACSKETQEDPIRCYDAVAATCFTSSYFDSTNRSKCISSTAEDALKGGAFDKKHAGKMCEMFMQYYDPAKCLLFTDAQCKVSKNQTDYNECSENFILGAGQVCTNFGLSEAKTIKCIDESLSTCSLTTKEMREICPSAIAQRLKDEGEDPKFDNSKAEDYCKTVPNIDVATCSETMNDRCSSSSANQGAYDDCLDIFFQSTFKGCKEAVSGSDLTNCLNQALKNCPLDQASATSCATDIAKNIANASGGNAAFASSCTSTYCIYAECWTPNGDAPKPTAVGDVCACKTQGGVKRYFKGKVVGPSEVVGSSGCSEGKSNSAINKTACGASPSGGYTAECMNGNRIQNIQIGYGPSVCACSSSTLKRYVTSDDKVITSVTYNHAYTCNDDFKVNSTLETRDVVSTACAAHSGMKTARITDSSGNLVTNITYSSSSSSSSSSTSTTGGVISNTTGGGSTSGGTTKIDGTTSGGSTTGGSTTGTSLTTGSTSGGTTKSTDTTSGGTTSGGSTSAGVSAGSAVSGATTGGTTK